MVGLVIVSHSGKLAQGVAELASSLAPEVRIAATGGLDLPGNPLGTDAMQIVEKIREVFSQDGVLVLVDIGSAVLSSQMALEQLTPEEAAHVLLCDAPLVEGAVAAAAQARLGRTLQVAAAEARAALMYKSAQFGSGPAPAARPASLTPETPTAPPLVVERSIVVNNPHGLHARPAAEFAQAAARFDADLQVENTSLGRGPVSAKSLLALLTLGVHQGHTIRLTASGADAEAALDALAAIVA